MRKLLLIFSTRQENIVFSVTLQKILQCNKPTLLFFMISRGGREGVLERRRRRRLTPSQRSTLWRSDQGERKSARHPPNGSAKATSEVRATRHSTLLN
jgi:hypothetical protein